MAKPKREGYSRYNVTFDTTLHDEIVGKVIPANPELGARDFSSFVELASRRLVDQVKADKKTSKPR